MAGAAHKLPALMNIKLSKVKVLSDGAAQLHSHHDRD